MASTRKWHKYGQEPYAVERIWKQMPTDFNNDYDVLTKKMKRLFTEII